MIRKPEARTPAAEDLDEDVLAIVYPTDLRLDDAIEAFEAISEQLPRRIGRVNMPLISPRLQRTNRILRAMREIERGAA